MELGLAIALIAVAVVLGVAIGFVIGVAHRKKVAEAAIGSASEEATLPLPDEVATIFKTV